jgi:hypothetical protein
MTEKAILAGGCFWGMLDLLRKRPGLISTRAGYTGGDVPNATWFHTNERWIAPSRLRAPSAPSPPSISRCKSRRSI